MHSETIRWVDDVELVASDEDGFTFAHLSVVTTGNVRKTIRLPHYCADALRVHLEAQLGLMEREAKRSSWTRSIEWIKSRRAVR